MQNSIVIGSVGDAQFKNLACHQWRVCVQIYNRTNGPLFTVNQSNVIIIMCCFFILPASGITI